jgi:hypothetical protein
MKKIILVSLLAVTVLTGCTSRKIKYGEATYSSFRFGNKESFGGLEITDTNGVKLKITAYQNDQVQAIGVAVDAAVTAAIQGAK